MVQELTEEQREVYDAALWDWGGWIDRGNRDIGFDCPRDIADEAAAMMARRAVAHMEDGLGEDSF